MAISGKKLAYYEHLASKADEATAKAIEQLIAEVHHLNRLVHWFIYDGWDCPKHYDSSVTCRRHCPVWARHEHDHDKDYYCTTEEILEFAESDIRKEMSHD